MLSDKTLFEPEYCSPLSFCRESARIDRAASEKRLLSAELLMEAAGALAARETVSHFRRFFAAARSGLPETGAGPRPDGLQPNGPRPFRQSGFAGAPALTDFDSRASFRRKPLRRRGLRASPAPGEKSPAGPPGALVFCGPGHNGGDGLVFARHLHSLNFHVTVFAAPSDSPLVERQKQRLSGLNIRLFPLDDWEKAKGDCDSARLAGNRLILADALFGTGLSKNTEGKIRRLIEWMNSAPLPRVSLDIPSGLNGDTGCVLGLAVRADLTLSFGLNKPGFYLNEGPAQSGRVVRLPIGFPPELLSFEAKTGFLFDEYRLASKLPQRAPRDHKARQGHVLILAGRPGFYGAGALCAQAALRMGAGYVTWAAAAPDGAEGSPAFPALAAASVPEALTARLSDPALFEKKTAVSIGPGLGTGETTKKLLKALADSKLPAVIDADGFTLCVRENLFPAPSNWVFTPHSGELSRLFGLKGKEINEDRCGFALKAAEKTGAAVLLKGFHSVLAWRGRCGIIPSGNAGLAKAGTGDVLTGFIGALSARKIAPPLAAVLGAFVHGRIADDWIQSGQDKDALTARDLAENLPLTLRRLRKISSQPHVC